MTSLKFGSRTVARAALAVLSLCAATIPLQSAEADMAVKIDGAWTWKVMRTEYLKWAKVHLSDATYIGYHSGLGAAKNSVFKKDFEHIEKKAIANITQLDILMIRHNILERGGMVDGVPAGFIRTAELTEAALRGGQVRTPGTRPGATEGTRCR